MSNSRKIRNEKEIEEYILEIQDLFDSEDNEGDEDTVDDPDWKLDEDRSKPFVVGDDESDSFKDEIVMAICVIRDSFNNIIS